MSNSEGAAAPGRRRRSTLLAAVERLAQFTPPLNTNSLKVFLYACENEGLTVSELAHICGLHVATAARLARSFGVEGEPDTLEPAHGLLELRSSETDRRLKFIHLTPLGARLRDELDRFIAQADPIMALSANTPIKA